LFGKVGITSGSALVGAARLESLTGAPWTYTGRGMVTNIAARIAALASGGGLYVPESTANRVKQDFPLKPIEKFALKNISERVQIFAVLGN
jgi:class 3 adenylate cyclase